MINVTKNSVLVKGVVALAVVLGATSCEDDFETGNPTIDDGTIRFEVVDDNNVVIGSESRSAEDTVSVVQNDPIRYFQEIIGNDTIQMEFTQCHNSSSTFMSSPEESEEPESRGEYYVTGKIRKFQGVAYTDNGSKLFFNEEQTVNADNTVSTGRFWPQSDQPLTFFGYAKSLSSGNMTTPVFTNNATEHKATFNYTMPAAGHLNASGDSIDAQNHPDIVFAVVPSKTKTTENVNMPFHHALAAITFKVGTIDKLSGATVKSVALTGCYTSGTCEVSSASTEKPNDVVFTWSNTSGSTTYKQTFKQAATTGDQLGGIEHTFLIIPQVYTNTNPKLQITFTMGDTDTEKDKRTYTLEKSLSEIITEFKADHHYYFSIGTDKGEVNIDVEDKVEGKVKTFTSIQNTGLAAGYIRAAIVGYWVRSSESSTDIMIPWSVDDTSTGTLVKPANWSTYWVQGNDGYYYYKDIVPPGGFTQPLFTTYTVTLSAPPVTGAYLEINLIGQIVQKNYLSTAWTIPTP